MSVRYAFIADWFDTIASQTRSFTACFYPADNSVELIDNKQRRIFLRRTPVPQQLSEFFIGGAVNIYGRQLKITGYADSFTQAELGNKLEKTLLMIKSDAVAKLASILSAVGAAGLKVVSARMCELSGAEAGQFGSPGGRVIGLEVVGADAVSTVSALTGSGVDIGRDTCYSSNVSTASDDLDEFFVKKIGTTTYVMSEQSALCVIKPSLLGQSSDSFGRIVSELTAGGFEVTGITSHTLSRASAEEFFEVYKGVVTEYPQMVDELSSGPLVALEVTGPENFREFCGPADPEIAKQLRPHTLRAIFGSDKVRNGVHCTDLPEDIPLELEYFFKIKA